MRGIARAPCSGYLAAACTAPPGSDHSSATVDIFRRSALLLALLEQRFSALRPSVGWCALLSSQWVASYMLRFARHPVCPRFSQGVAWLIWVLQSCWYFLLGRRFFARCLRGGYSPCDLLFACVLSSSLVWATSLPLARHLVPSFLPRCSLDHVCACAVVGFSAGRRFFALCSRGSSSPCALLFAGELRGRILPSPFPAVGVGGRFGAARRSVCLSTLWLGSCFCLVCLVFPLGAASSR